MVWFGLVWLAWKQAMKSFNKKICSNEEFILETRHKIQYINVSPI